MKTLSKILLITLLIALLVTSGFSKEIERAFDGKKELNIELVLSNCTLLKSPDQSIHVKVKYTYDDKNYEVSFRDRGSSLTVKEHFHKDSHKGDAEWTIKIPDGLEVEFESATGDIIVKQVSDIELEASSGTGDVVLEESNGEFEMNSGTGDVIVTDCNGEFDLNSGTGDVEIKNCKGEFDANSGTGDVAAEKITIESDAEFNSGTGEAMVKHPLGEAFDLSINSGTNDAILDMDGQKIEGYFEFKANRDRGDIESPIKFDKTNYEDDGGDTVKKSFSKGNTDRRFYVSTGTGTAELKK